jgi:hypothetical protein
MLKARGDLLTHYEVVGDHTLEIWFNPTSGNVTLLSRLVTPRNSQALFMVEFDGDTAIRNVLKCFMEQKARLSHLNGD